MSNLGGLDLAACSSEPESIVGSYTTTITPRDNLTDTLNFGVWTVHFNADGSYTAAIGEERVNGRYQSTGNRLLINGNGAPLNTFGSMGRVVLPLTDSYGLTGAVLQSIKSRR